MALALAVVGLTWVYSRQIRRMLEQPDLFPRPRASTFSLMGRFLLQRVLRNPLQQSLFLFIARTLTRSREHRLLLAFYGGIGLAIGLAYTKGLVSGKSGYWYEPNVALLMTGLVFLFFSVAGVKALFAMPFALKANWIFQVTAVHKPASYARAVRRSLLLIAAVPVWFGASVLYLSLWPGPPALGHVAVLVTEGVLLGELLLYEFRKIPFTCSYLPGKSNLRLRAGAYAFLLFLCLEIAGHLELWALEKPARFCVLFSLLVLWAMWAHRRTAKEQASVYSHLRFEEAPPAVVQTLDLRQEKTGPKTLRYLDVLQADPELPWGVRLRRILAWGMTLLFVFLGVGFLYEQIGEWRDRTLYPPVGRSIDIGGRSLNLYCAGQGPETVVMDSGGGVPGYGWVLVERSVSQFTRACWYDRAGYGWSDPAPKQRTSQDIVNDLHQLLRAAHVPPPYVLVGHSFGGFNVRVFAAQYSQEVIGLVLVDSADEYEDPAHAPAALQSPLRRFLPAALLRLVLEAASVLVHAGLLRLLDKGPGLSIGKLNRQQTALVHTLQRQPKALDANIAEGLARPETLHQVQAVRDLGNLPLLVLTGAKEYRYPDPLESIALRSFIHNWVEEVQPRIARLSRKGRQILVTDSGHAIPFEDPDAIVAAIRKIIQTAQAPLKKGG